MAMAPVAYRLATVPNIEQSRTTAVANRNRVLVPGTGGKHEPSGIS
jgi:hypothetical protein